MNKTFLASLLPFIIFLSGCKIFFGFGSWSFAPPITHAELAQQLKSEGKFSEAIEQYKKHIENRLADNSRPESENPHFYFILIGDIYLGQNKPDEAKEAFEIAEENFVEKSLLIDRFRKLAAWYEQRENLDQAMIILKEYRELEPSIFDYDIDQIHRKMVKKEEL